MLDFRANAVAQIFWPHPNLSEMCSLTSQFLGPTPLVSIYQAEIILLKVIDVSLKLPPLKIATSFSNMINEFDRLKNTRNLQESINLIRPESSVHWYRMEESSWNQTKHCSLVVEFCWHLIWRELKHINSLESIFCIPDRQKILVVTSIRSDIYKNCILYFDHQKQKKVIALLKYKNIFWFLSLPNWEECEKVSVPSMVTLQILEGMGTYKPLQWCSPTGYCKQALEMIIDSTLRAGRCVLILVLLAEYFKSWLLQLLDTWQLWD